MQIRHEVVVPALPPVLWEILWDVARIAECVPGCAEARELEPHRRYAVRMSQKVGPVKLSVPLDVRIVEAAPPERLVLDARGRDPAIGAEIAMQVDLCVEPRAGASAVRIDATARVLGKLGGLAQGVIQRKAEESVREFGERLRALVAARVPDAPA